MVHNPLDIARRLPSGFTFGTATSSWQIEGDSAGRGSSIWDDFAKIQGKILDGASADPACDHIHHWQDDLKLLSWLGVDAYRFSFSWPRVQPGGSGDASQSGLAFYDRLIDDLLAREIDPVATIYHWDLPSELEAKGGWAWKGITDYFANYTEILANKFGDRISRWATFNEPWCSAFLGYASTVHAPGKGNPQLGFQAAYNLLLSHGRAIKVLRQHGAKNLGIVLNLTTILSDDPDLSEAVHHIDGIQNRMWLDALNGKAFPQDIINRTESFIDWSFTNDSEFEEMATPIDWLGINYYTPNRVAQVDANSTGHIVGQDTSAYPGTPPVNFIAHEPRTQMGWEIDAESLATTLMMTSQRMPGVPFYIAENGGAFPDHLIGGVIDDQDRIDYFYNHINVALDTRALGVNLQGYFAWSLLDNIEWAEGWTKRFGIVHVDNESQMRTPKASAYFLKEILANRPH